MPNSELNKEFDTLKQDVSKLRGDVASLVNALQDAGSDKVQSARAAAGKEYERRRARAREALNGARACGGEYAASVEEEIASHPVTSLVAAFGAGFIVAKLISLGGRPESHR